MILVDKDIKVFLANADISGHSQTSIVNGVESCITNIGYDLRSGNFAYHNKMVKHCELLPGESVFVESEEIVQFDDCTVGRVCLKNSRIRMGLSLDAPTYQPGHKTRIYFRITNISTDEIILSAGEMYATLIFEQLKDEPENPYKGTFQNEFDFKGLADYKSKYTPQMKYVDKKLDNIEDIEKRIYGNVITILTIFVAVFTILNINISMGAASASVLDFLIYNLSVIGGISALALMMHELLAKTRDKRKGKLWLVPGICLCILIAIAIFITTV